LNEGMPMVLLEAMAAGKSIISTSVGAIPGVINNMKEGLLVSPGEVDELKAAIILLLGDPGLSEELSVNARKKVVSEFSSKAMCDSYVHLYEGCIHAR